VLLESPVSTENKVDAYAVFGTYGLARYQFSGDLHTSKTDLKVQYAHQVSDGYREQTAMRRDAFNADFNLLLTSDHKISTSLFYTDLYYETPGGLNKTQYETDPAQARPPTPVIRGAVEQQAAVSNKTGYLGIMDDYQWNEAWSTQTGIYGSLTSFENPTIRNYEIRDEYNFGARTQTQYVFDKTLKGKITLGGEYQYFHSPIAVHGNTYGVIDTVQTDDKLKSSLLLFFAQAELNLTHDFFLTVGASANFLKYNFTALYPSPTTQQERRFDPVLSPRVALLKKFKSISIYASLSQGFSPPSLAEVRPSAGTYNNDLKPERGLNYEIGFRGSIAKGQIRYDIAAYDFRLDETIVIQRTADGAEYFVNAGETSQRGLEATVTWQPNLASKLLDISLWTSYTYNHYRFKNYENDGNDFSGNRLTGVAPTIVLWGVDFSISKFYFNATANYTDALPLNDANTEYASEYFLLGARIGYRSPTERNIRFEVFTGIDNALDKKYSLGNDLNAVGGRYYNAAAPRNYYIGLKITPTFSKKN
jgi:iron complex outermembrane recepter protein